MMMVDEMLDGLEQTGIRTGFGDARLRIGPAKLFIDGSIGGRTARMHHPYVGEAENVGLWMQTPAAFKAKFKRAHDLGWQCCAHAIGDAAIDLLLDCYEEAMTANPRPDARHRIEHCEFITDPAVFDRIKRLGVVPIPGTTFLRDFRPVYVQNLGPERLRYANAMRTFIDRGIVAAASSDAPVVTVSPLAGIETMVTRKDFAGDAAFPEEAISFEEAVWAYTWAGAYASFEENIKGSLTPGKLGDVTVLNADARTVAPDDIAEMTVDYTIMDGEIVHSA
jgi:predicted amidohydrolase YtcJ